MSYYKITISGFTLVVKWHNHLEFLEKSRYSGGITPIELIQLNINAFSLKVKVGNGQEMAQSERNSHFRNRGGKKKLNKQSGTYTCT